MTTATLSKTEREALKAIHRLSIERRSGDPAVKTGDLSAQLGLTPGTITSTLKRLADDGLVLHHLYRGVTLTDAGEQVALATIRRHRIVETFLANQLNYTWQEADRLAPTFEHALPSEVEARMFEILGKPKTCPHGFDIPNLEGSQSNAVPTLSECAKGDTVAIALAGSTETEVVAYLETLGIHPGTVIEVVENSQIDGVVKVRVGANEVVIGDRVARQIFVRKETEQEQTA